MVERGQYLRFALEALHAGGVLSEGAWQNLDGDLAVEFGVGGAVNGTHAAFAEFGRDFVVRDLGRHGHSLSTPIVSFLTRFRASARSSVSWA
jgi:hypothetical protein